MLNAVLTASSYFDPVIVKVRTLSAGILTSSLPVAAATPVPAPAPAAVPIAAPLPPPAKPSNQRSCGCSAADFGRVALGMALALAADARAVNSLSVDGSQAQGELTRFVQASAAVHVSDLAFHRIAGFGHLLAMYNDVTASECHPRLWPVCAVAELKEY